jgi:PAS domain-containing protein
MSRIERPAAAECGSGSAEASERRGNSISNVAVAAISVGDLYKLFEERADAVSVVTIEGAICFWSLAAEHMFGYAAPDVPGRVHTYAQGFDKSAGKQEARRRVFQSARRCGGSL